MEDGIIMREKILTFIEKNSRIDLKELAIILGVDEAAVVNELQKNGRGAYYLRIPYPDRLG